MPARMFTAAINIGNPLDMASRLLVRVCDIARAYRLGGIDAQQASLVYSFLMSTTSNRSLRHMAWANQRVYSSVLTLPEEALSSYLVNPEWTAGIILQHIVNGADWFSYCLTQAPWTDIKIPLSMDDVDELASLLATLDKRIISQDEMPDIPMTINEEGQSWKAMRSTILVQAVHHATEHRAQLIDALEYQSFKPIILDDIDLWAFERFERASPSSE